MSDVPCFWMEDLPLERLWLRRFADGPCPANPGAYSYHCAMEPYRDRAPAAKEPNAHGLMTIRTLEPPPPDDAQCWPVKCVCGFRFPEEAMRQLFAREFYRRADTGLTMLLDEAPAGAMWNAWWIGRESRVYKGPGSFIGPDGIALMVKTPGGDWFVDGPANNGPGWTRSGAPPRVTASPSILIPHGRGASREPYHGWLRNGVLVPC